MHQSKLGKAGVALAGLATLAAASLPGCYRESAIKPEAESTTTKQSIPQSTHDTSTDEFFLWYFVVACG